MSFHAYHPNKSSDIFTPTFLPCPTCETATITHTSERVVWRDVHPNDWQFDLRDHPFLRIPTPEITWQIA